MRVVMLATLVGLAGVSTAPAQVVPSPPAQQQPQPADTVKVPPFRVERPVSPLGAMWRSLLVPGWGQAALDRHVTGAVFIFWEGLTLTMTVKSAQQLAYQERIGLETEALDAKRQEVQDWAVLLVFNHLMAGAEAFVAANLWDFPTELEARALPEGRVGVGVRVVF